MAKLFVQRDAGGVGEGDAAEDYMNLGLPKGAQKSAW